jgi:mannose-6-phosphate isomerase-like protein (cupin superfamily)
MIETVDISKKFDLFTDAWHPRIVGELNESYLKLVRLQGEFVWHNHENEDELFFVVRGTLTIKLRGRDLILHENQFVIIPRGVDHLPVAESEVLAMLIEPKSTLNTGNVQNERTSTADWI